MLFVFYGCEAHFQESELVGVYKANHKKAEDIIFLKKDHTYRHTYKTSENLFERVGKWEYEYFQGQPLISFYNFDHRWRYDFVEEKGVRNIWPAFPERTLFGKIILGLDDDLGFYYEKFEIENSKK